jgi:2-hydroxychromene-2-carboxylate isomerase
LRELGRDPVRVLTSARTGRIEERYKRDTEEAKALGVFGSPTFAVDGEVFWGDDRLEDAVAWFKAKNPDARPEGQH